MNMLTIKKLGAQGDVMFRRIKGLPATAQEQVVRGPIVVAHSETGHHHAIDATDGVRLFVEPANPNICYLMLDGVEHADVVHHRSWDTHDTVRLLRGKAKTPAIFEARRQRERAYVPAGWRRVED
jgi:hypothetical protein